MNRNQPLRALLCFALVWAILCAAPLNAIASATELDFTLKASSVETARDRQLRPNGHGKQVTWFQSRLSKLGYYKGKIVSLYNKSTYNACKEFQECNGLKANGIGNKETRDLLFSKDAVSRTKYDTDNFILSIKKGKTGEQVVQYQDRLIAYGYLSGSPSGTFDNETVTATKYFQHAHGKKTNGVASREIRQLINDGTKVVDFASYEAIETVVACKKGDWGLGVSLAMAQLKDMGYYSGTLGPHYTTAMTKAVLKFEQFNNISKPDGKLSKSDRERLNSGNILTYAEICGPDTVKPGASGRMVLKIQVILKSLKFYKGPLNSKYTSSLKSAVKRFQKKYKQYPSGICYSPTMQLLNDKNPLPDVPDELAMMVIAVALDQMGKPYTSVGSGPDSYDCSGFTTYVFNKGTSGKIKLPHNSKAQSKKGALVAIDDDLLPGDLVFFATGNNKKNLNHVGVVVSVEGNNIKFVHASSAAKKVITSSFKDTSNSNFYQNRFLHGRRVW